MRWLRKAPNGLPADHLDHAAEDEKIRVAVRPASAGIEVERARRVLVDDRIGRRRLLHLAIDEIERIEVAIPGDMIAEIEQRDVARRGSAWGSTSTPGPASPSLPSCARSSTAEQVNCFVTEPTANMVSARDRVMAAERLEPVAFRQHDFAVLGDADREPDQMLRQPRSRGSCCRPARRPTLRENGHVAEMCRRARLPRSPVRDRPRDNRRSEIRDEATPTISNVFIAHSATPVNVLAGRWSRSRNCRGSLSAPGLCRDRRRFQWSQLHRSECRNARRRPGETDDQR